MPRGALAIIIIIIIRLRRGAQAAAANRSTGQRGAFVRQCNNKRLRPVALPVSQSASQSCQLGSIDLKARSPGARPPPPPPHHFHRASPQARRSAPESGAPFGRLITLACLACAAHEGRHASQSGSLTGDERRRRRCRRFARLLGALWLAQQLARASIFFATAQLGSTSRRHFRERPPDWNAEGPRSQASLVVRC